jgi:hypothetical protein
MRVAVRRDAADVRRLEIMAWKPGDKTWREAFDGASVNLSTMRAWRFL